MSIRNIFITLSLMVLVALVTMSGLLWVETNKIAQLGEQHAISKSLKVDMLMLRRHEKDFFLRKNLKYIDKFNKTFSGMNHRLELLKQGLDYSPELQEELSNSQINLLQYQANFQRLVELDKQIGLDETAGLQGRFNEAEELLKHFYVSNSDVQSKSNVLHLLLLANHFQTSFDESLQPRVEREIRLAKASFQGEQFSQTIQALSDFDSAATSLAQAFIERGLDENSGLRGTLRASIHQFEKEMGKVSTDINESIASNLIATRKEGIIIAMLLTVVIAGVMLWQAKHVTGRLKQANDKMVDISGGEGDLTQHLELGGHDEVTDLADSVNDFIDTTAGLVREIKDKGATVENGAHHSVELNRRSQQAIEEQRNHTLAVNQAVSELVAAVELIAQQSCSVKEAVFNADEQMALGATTMAHTNTHMDELKSLLQNNSRVMGNLTSASSEIEKVTSVIRSIAEQTNLLALNAAIEAARAGEAGRGFAVVADEVRTLASRTQTSTHEIESMISNLQTHVSDSEQAMKASLELSETMTGAIDQASSAMSGNKQSMDEINLMVEQIASATEEQMYTVQGVENATQSILLAAEQLLSDSTESCETCEQLELNAHQMKEDVERFVV